MLDCGDAEGAELTLFNISTQDGNWAVHIVEILCLYEIILLRIIKKIYAAIRCGNQIRGHVTHHAIHAHEDKPWGASKGHSSHGTGRLLAPI